MNLLDLYVFLSNYGLVLFGLSLLVLSFLIVHFKSKIVRGTLFGIAVLITILSLLLTIFVSNHVRYNLTIHDGDRVVYTAKRAKSVITGRGREDGKIRIKTADNRELVYRLSGAQTADVDTYGVR